MRLHLPSVVPGISSSKIPGHHCTGELTVTDIEKLQEQCKALDIFDSSAGRPEDKKEVLSRVGNFWDICCHAMMGYRLNNDKIRRFYVVIFVCTLLHVCLHVFSSICLIGFSLFLQSFFLLSSLLHPCRS